MFFRNFAFKMVYIDDHIWDFDLDAALRDISEQRREQALRFRHELGQRQSVLAYLLLKKALLREFGISENPLFVYGEHGKPSIVGHPDIHFNLSHCREAVACAVDKVPVGIDVESVRPLKESLARYTMSESELQLIHSADNPALAFTRFWTMKEACLKLTGEGLRDRMATVLDTPSCIFETVVSANGKYVYSLCKSASQH